MSTILSSEDVTLPDYAWLDSFDKLLGDRELLRLNKVVKKNVNVSRNMNSSYENSNLEKISMLSPIAKVNQQVFGCSALLREHIVTSELSPIWRESGLSPILKENPAALGLSPTAKSNQEAPKRSLLRERQSASVLTPVTLKQNCQKLCRESSIIKKRQKRGNIIHLDVPFKNNNGKENNEPLNGGGHFVSTPIKTITKPFDCTVSPIDMFRFLNAYNNYSRKTATKKKKRSARCQGNNIENVENNISKCLVAPVIDVSIDSPWTILKKKRQCQRQVHFKEKEEAIEESNHVGDNQRLTIQPGKWRKSLNHIKRSSTQKLQVTSLRKSINLYVENINENKKTNTVNMNENKKSVYAVENFKAKVLQFCQPHKIVTFKDAFPVTYLMDCQKIGEGTFGEVFMHSTPTQGTQNSCCQTVLKIIPIEGQQLINGELQKTFEQILPEIVITVALCGLNNATDTNVTNGFVNVQKIRCVKGKYPDHLIKLWEEYDARKQSENDHPKQFVSKQQYIILELNYGGNDLESWTFRNAEQSYFILQQIILTLAVGEETYQFEHRDLHWGNILIAPTTDKHITYKLNGNDIIIPTKGVKMTIIDYTLSRIMYNNYCYYCDLSNEKELFEAQGDYQFDIYRMMKDILHNKWQDFIPKTNVFWISYIIKKLINGVTYKNIRSSIHNQYIKKLHELNESILEFNSCVDCVKHLFVST